jgi:hypothetical protein
VLDSTQKNFYLPRERNERNVKEIDGSVEKCEE